MTYVMMPGPKKDSQTWASHWLEWALVFMKDGNLEGVARNLQWAEEDTPGSVRWEEWPPHIREYLIYKRMGWKEPPPPH